MFWTGAGWIPTGYAPPPWKGAQYGRPASGPGSLADPGKRLAARLLDGLVALPAFLALAAITLVLVAPHAGPISPSMGRQDVEPRSQPLSHREQRPEHAVGRGRIRHQRCLGGRQHAQQFHDTQTLTEHWNGSAWGIVAITNPSPNDALAGVARSVAGQPVWAVGNQIPSARYQNLIVVTTA